MPTLVRDGVRLFWSEVGAGLCTFWHTGGGGDGSMWERAGYLDALPGRRHLLFDHRGHGRSDKPDGVAAHRLDEYVADVVAVLDAAGVERTTLIGYSGGAFVVFAVAARHPERVDAVIAIGGVAHPDESNGWRREAAAEVREMGLRAMLLEMNAREAEPAPTWLIDNLAATPTEMFALALEGWADEPSEFGSFAQIEAPTMIVCGEQENADGSAELAAAELRDGTAVVLPGLGHLAAFWRSDLTAPRISAFLARRVPG